MKNLQWAYRLPTKIAAIFAAGLLGLGGLFFLGTAGGSILLAGSEGTTKEAQRGVATYFLSLYDWRMAMDYANDGKADENYDDVPYTYVITDENGVVLDATYDGGPYFASSIDHYYWGEWVDEDTVIDHHVTATLYAPPLDELKGDSWLALGVRLVGKWHTLRWSYCVGGAACWLTALAVMIYLYCAAGRHPGEDTPRCNALDRIPFDLFTALYAAIGVFLLVLVKELSYGPVAVFLLSLAVFAACVVSLLFSYTMSIATRTKTHTLWCNTLVGYLLRVLAAGGRAIGRHLPALWQWLLAIGGITLLEFILLYINRWEPDNLAILWFCEKLLLIPLTLWFIVGLCRLRVHIRRLASGENAPLPSVKNLPGSLRPTAEDLNHIQDGMAAQVEARLKSERFKAELITNVSHDIKTPLTSVINYVDLLEKEKPENPKMQEYLAILQRQSQRLKKLIEDLMEASKASTGNLTIHPVPCQLGLMLTQLAGEYSERLAAADLELLIAQPPHPVTVMADGRHLGRAFDNLLLNVCKYAMAGTRVYLDLLYREGQAQIILRNISRSPLHISGEELLERFVRGDSSRNTEGSGLGLSIARSLVELHGGSLRLTVDGDLFRVDISLPAATADA